MADDPLTASSNSVPSTPKAKPAQSAPRTHSSKGGQTSSHKAWADWRAKRAARTPSQRRRGLIGWLIVLAIALGIGLWQVTWLNAVVTAVLSRPILWLGLVAIVLLPRLRRFFRSGVPIGLLLAAVIIGGIFFMINLGHGSRRAMDASFTKSTAAAPSYELRAPLDVVTAQTAGHVTITGAPGRTRYLPTLGKYGALAEFNSGFSGYGQVVWQTVSPDGQTTAKNCNFDQSAGKKLGGVFSHNLNRAIIRLAGFGTMIDERNSYGYCDAQGNAVGVFPITKNTGFVFPHQVAAGVVTMDHTGKLTLLRDVAPGQLPGPVYPVTLSIQQREATRAQGSLWQDLRNMIGYQDTSADSGDPNAGNNADFMLLRAGSTRADFVTPLTLRGGSSAISAVGVVPMDTVHAGSLNEMTAYALPTARQANSAVAGRIRSDYADLPWASGMGVYEIAPNAPDSWVATLGQRNGIQYRVLLNADSSSCLTDPRGTKLWCVKDGQRVGSAPNTSTSGTITVPASVSSLTDRQLAQLAQQLADAASKVAAEQVKRAK